jgi:hypothetical protein
MRCVSINPTSTQVLGAIGSLSALPHLVALRVDSCRTDAGGVSDNFWEGEMSKAFFKPCHAAHALQLNSCLHSAVRPTNATARLPRPGLARLTRLQWLSLGYLERARLAPISRLPALRALQLRGLTTAPAAAALAGCLAPLPRLIYLGIEGARLDGAGGGCGAGAAAAAGSYLSPSGGDFVADAVDIVTYGR